MTRVVNFLEYETNAAEATALYSPDGSRFVVRTRRGDLARNVNVESLLLFRTADVEHYLSHRRSGTQPVPRLLATVDVKDDVNELSQIQWIDDTHLAFIGGDTSGVNQAYLLDVSTSSLSQLTESQTHVVSFAAARDTVVYYARVPVTPRQVVTVRNQSLGELLFWNAAPTSAPLQLFKRLGADAPVVAIGPVVRLIPRYHRMWISPSARIAITYTPAVDAPPYWSDYRLSDIFRFTPDKIVSDPTSWDLIFRTRYALVDLTNDTLRPLLDAPSGVMALGATPQEVFWMDEDDIIVTNTFLPLQIADAAERQRRSAAPAIAHVNTRTGAAQAITWESLVRLEDEPDRKPAEHIARVQWDGGSQTLTVGRRPFQAPHVRFQHYEQRGGRWRAVNGKAPVDRRTAIDRREGLNERPRVHVLGGKCVCTKVLFDPDPDADRFTFGHIDVVEWKDRNGIEWKGGLVLPPAYDRRKPLPLVVQTHGFIEGEFLTDGPYAITTGMAAQPLANVGIAVLQVADNQRAETLDEAALYAEGYRAGIEYLVQRGIADPARVGMIAFSRSGLPIVRMLADHPDLLKAVNIADASWWGYLLDLLQVNVPRDFADQGRRLSGGSAFDTGNVPEWIARNPLYGASRSRAAVLIESNGEGGPMYAWERFALLRAAGRPVDFIWLPQASHNVRKPAERLASQGISVDWFRFWLLGQEDPDPAKAGQYAYWAKLRLTAATESPVVP